MNKNKRRGLMPTRVVVLITHHEISNCIPNSCTSGQLIVHRNSITDSLELKDTVI